MLELSTLLTMDWSGPLIAEIDSETVLMALSSIFATVLFIISLLAYRRDGRRRLLFVSGAFFLFAIKGFLDVITDIMLPNATWPDTITYLLDFSILALFFIGLIKK